MSLGRATCALLWAAALGAAEPCISHHKGYCSPKSTVRPPHPCGLSCGASLLGRRPPPGLCTGSPVTGCFHGSGRRLPWSAMQPGWARTSNLGVPPLLLAQCAGWVAPVPQTHGVLVLSRPLAGLCVHLCAVSRATWLLFTGVLARCVALLVRSPGPPGSCSPVCTLGVFRRVLGVLGHLAPVHRCARSVRCVASGVSWTPWLLFTSVLARCVALRVRCPGPPGSCSGVGPLDALRCVFGFRGQMAPVHPCASSVCCVTRAVSWAAWLLFTGVPALCVVLRVRCPGPLGSCSPLCQVCVLCCVCHVLGVLAPAHGRARSVRSVVCSVSWATWFLFTCVLAQCVALRCPGPPGSSSPVCQLGALRCVFGVFGHLAPVQRCARSVCCIPCAVSWVTWLLFTGVHTRCLVFGVLGHLAPVHRCACSVCCVACVVSWAPWLLFTGVPAL